MTADLHIHTTASDGLFSCQDVIKEALSAGVDVVSVTDHDTAFNTEEIARLSARAGIKSVNGTEISAYEGTVKIHILAYGADIKNTGFELFMNELYNGSVKRAEQIVFKLKLCGFKLSLEEVAAERSSPLTPIHAMHIARAAAKKRYAAGPFEFYKAYMMPGRPAFSNVCRPSPERTVAEIKAAGGLAVLAHPGRVEMNPAALKELIERLSAVGLGGIEAVYSTHTVKQTAYYKELAAERGLLVTGGSDTHCRGGSRKVGSPVFSPDAALREVLGI